MKEFKVRIFAIAFATLITSLTISGCKKQNDFLDQKPQGNLATISTIENVQSLLSNENIFNYIDAPGIGSSSTDDYYMTYAKWIASLPEIQNTYVWAKQIYAADENDADWNGAYTEIYYANTILDALPKISAPQSQLDVAKGEALFFRSIAFYNLVQIYALPYDPTTANTTLGIPLRLNSDLNTKSVRATEKQCYDQIISDLNLALGLVNPTSKRVTEPNKISVNALLARVFLGMSDYSNAYKYSNAALNLKSTLTDFNNIIPNQDDFFFADVSQFPLSEDIYHSTLQSPIASMGSRAIVDTLLYSSYENNDLRKSAFFVNYLNAMHFRGSYEFKIGLYQYDGLATDEMYLIRAESNARLGKTAESMADLNALLVKRYKTGTYVNRSATSSDDALVQILTERRKELLFRGLRWTDLRRLNKDPKFAITLKRNLNGVTYTLPPNDPRYALPIPENEITLSGIQQNPR